MDTPQIFEEDGMLKHNVLRSWPLYRHLYDRYVRPQQDGDESAQNALLIGAMTSLTARAYAVMAQEVYGAQKAHVVDIRGGGDKTRHGVFVYGDGRRMPYRSGSMDLIQTNHLFDQIGDRGWQSDPDTKRAYSDAVLRDAARVIKPGGHLLLIESAIAFDWSDPGGLGDYNQAQTRQLKETLASRLLSLGFADVYIEPAYTLKGSAWLFDITRNFAVYEREMTPGTFGVVARKV